MKRKYCKVKRCNNRNIGLVLDRISRSSISLKARGLRNWRKPYNINNKSINITQYNSILEIVRMISKEKEKKSKEKDIKDISKRYFLWL